MADRKTQQDALNHLRREAIEVDLNVLEVNFHGVDFFCSLELLYHDGYGWQFSIWVNGDRLTHHSLYKETKQEAWRDGLQFITERTLEFV